MEITNHPLQLLHADTLAVIRETAADAERSGKLLPAQLTVAGQQQWFKMLVPKQYGGLELSLPDEVRLIEAISCADGSMGWTITLCAGAGWFGGFLEPALSECIFNDPYVCLAGSGAAAGTAEITNSGYLINGLWNYASGAMHATHYTANCYITHNTVQVLDDEGKPLILPFVFDKKDVTVLPAWNYIGLTATGSHSFEVKNLFVAKDRCFKIDPQFAVVDAPLYQYPFLQLAEATLAVNIAGMAIHFIDLCNDVFKQKVQTKHLDTHQQSELYGTMLQAIHKINQARGIFYQAVDHSWLNFLTNHAPNDKELLQVSQTSRALAKTAIKIVDDLYLYCGLTAASTSTEINRVWRDVHTASQHSLLTFKSK
jgi:alkylation response protein AidB-like acyl-CoA dehydrogenase